MSQFMHLQMRNKFIAI